MFVYAGKISSPVLRFWVCMAMEMEMEMELKTEKQYCCQNCGYAVVAAAAVFKSGKEFE